MDKIKTYIAVVLGIFALSGSIYGAVTYYTPLSQHEALASKVSRGDVQDQIRWIQQQIWSIQQNFHCYEYSKCMDILPDTVKGQYRFLDLELKDLRRELKELEL